MRDQPVLAEWAKFRQMGEIWGPQIWRKWAKLTQKVGESSENEYKVGDLGEI